MNRVAFISSMEAADDSRIVKMMREVRETGCEVHVLMPPAKNESLDPERYIHYPLPIVHHHFRPDVGRFGFIKAAVSRLRSCVLIMKRLGTIKPEICQCHEPDSWFLGILARWFWGAKVVTDIHEVYESRATAFPQFSRPMMEKLIRFFMGWMSRRTDCVFHVSESRKALYPAFACQQIVVNNYPALEPEAEVQFGQSNLDGKKRPFMILHSGPLRANYAAKEFLLALKELYPKMPSLKAVVLGGTKGPTDSFAVIMAELVEAGILEIIPHIPFEKVREYMQMADLGISLVLPIDLNHRLAVPRKMYEYLAAGLPIIGAEAPDVRAVLIEYQCGLVIEASNPGEIAAAIESLFVNEEKRRVFQANGLRASREFLNWDKEKMKIRSVYKSLMTQ